MTMRILQWLAREYRERTDLGRALLMFEHSLAASVYMLVSSWLLRPTSWGEGYLGATIIFVPALLVLGVGVLRSMRR